MIVGRVLAVTGEEIFEAVVKAILKNTNLPFWARLNNWWVKMTACSPQVRFSGKFKWIFEQRNQLI